MTDPANLERKYRRLLAWYPRGFRQEHEQEILAVLMACAREGRRRPGLVASADLVMCGLLMRLCPRVPRSARTVRVAVRLMCAGAAVTALGLIAAIIFSTLVGRSGAPLVVAGHAQPFPVAVTVGVVAGLAEIALWLWMALANSQGRNWARIVSTVLVGLATLHLFGNEGVVPMVFSVSTWLVGLAAVWLLWRPASGGFFKPHGLPRAVHSA